MALLYHRHCHGVVSPYLTTGRVGDILFVRSCTFRILIAAAMYVSLSAQVCASQVLN